MRNKPQYSVSSVDHALHLATLLQQEGALGVTEAAKLLDIAPSTAHRLLATLVYREFAERLPDRRYGPGKVLRPAARSEAPVQQLRRISLPHMRQLMRQTRETVNLTVLAAREMRIVATVESDQLLRVGNRMNRSLPADRSAGGNAMLALLPNEQLATLYRDDPDVDLARLIKELSTVRKRGFAINNQLTEIGVTAIGMAARDDNGEPLGALTITMPTARFDKSLLTGWAKLLSSAVSRIETTLNSEE